LPELNSLPVSAVSNIEFSTLRTVKGRDFLLRRGGTLDTDFAMAE
jgi:hypothetical protein